MKINSQALQLWEFIVFYFKKKEKINDIHVRIEFEITKDLIRNCNWFHTSGFSLKK
jgi:hypothetical protein